MDWWTTASTLLWRNAIAVVPLALLVTLVCRWTRCGPPTRHALWLTVLAWFVVPLALPAARPGRWLAPAREAAPRDRTAPLVTPLPHPRPSADARPAPGAPGVARDGPSPVAPRLPLRPTAPPAARPEARPTQESGRPFATAEDRRRWDQPTRPDPQHPTAALNLQPAAPGAQPSTARLRSAAPPGPARTAPARPPDVPAFAETPARAPAAPRIALDVVEPARRPAWDWQAWVVGLAALRDAAVALPPIPPALWIGGAAALLTVVAARSLHTRRLLRHAAPAPPDVARVVAGVSRHLGLRAAPPTLMVDACVSPMVLPGRRARLVLPRGLWRELDGQGRAAVVSHELAHIRRRDHWVRCLELLVGCVYWWHPVMWWVRRRLNEEAEYCCDAWVTWLMPYGRRAYAAALLRTSGYVSGQSVAGPVLGIGITSAPARRFARRLTMVMTHRFRPSLSVGSLVLILALASAGWMTTPASSCPDDVSKARAKSKARPPTPPSVLPPGHGPTAPACADAPALPAGAPHAEDDDDGKNTFRRHLVWQHLIPQQPGVPAQPAPPAQPARLLAFDGSLLAAPGDDDSLEKRLARLEAQIEQLARRLEQLGHQTPPTGFGTGGAVAPPPPDGGFVPGAGGAIEPRTYRLPEGKLDALLALMIRDDVPVRVAPRDGGIEVHATPQQHRIFEAFIRLIHPQAAGQSGGVASGNPYSDAMRMYEGALRTWPTEAARAAELEALARAQAQQRDAAAAALEQALAQQRARAQVGADRAAALEAQAQELERQAEALREQAERLAEEAEELGESDAPGARERARALRDQHREIERQARELERQGRQLEREAERLNESVERLNEEAERISEERDRLNDGAEERPDPPAEREAPRSGEPETTSADGAPGTVTAALMKAAGALRTDAGPPAAAALCDAGRALRERTATEAIAGLREAACALHREALGAGESVLPVAQVFEAAATLHDDAPRIVARILERAAQTALESGSAEAVRRMLAEATQAIESESQLRAASAEPAR